MTTTQLGGGTLQVINDLHTQGIDSIVVLMRHSARIVDTAENDAIQDLTEEGRQAAIEFGKGLPANGRFRFYSSVINRCIETSTFIKEGILSVNETAVIEPNVVMDELYAFFSQDVLKMDKIAYALMNKGEWAQFFRNWFNGEYPTEAIDPAAKSAETLLASLIGLLREETAVSTICVSHDFHLFLIKEVYLHLRPEDHEFIQFLEGVVIYEENGRYYIINHQTGAQLLPIIPIK